MGKKTLQHILWRQIYDDFGMSNTMQKYFLPTTNVFEANCSIWFRHPHSILTQGVYLKHQRMVLRRSKHSEVSCPDLDEPTLFGRTQFQVEMSIALLRERCGLKNPPNAVVSVSNGLLELSIWWFFFLVTRPRAEFRQTFEDRSTEFCLVVFRKLSWGLILPKPREHVSHLYLLLGLSGW